MLRVLQMIIFVACGLSGVVSQLVFWIEIEPVLRKLGFKYDVLALKPYPRGFLTLWEYKKYCVSEGTSLRGWYIYWVSLWLSLCLLIVYGVAIFGRW